MAFCFLLWCVKEQKERLSWWLGAVFWTFLPIFFIYNSSRTGWIAAAVLCTVLVIRHPGFVLKKVLPCVLIGVVVLQFSYGYATHGHVINNIPAKRFFEAMKTRGDVQYSGDRKRIIALEDGIELYEKSNPVLGSGLGGYKPFQIEKRGEYIEVIDFTGMWLLVETGALGLIVFVAFFMMCLWVMYREGYKKEQSMFHRAMFWFLLLFAGMTLLHELMYTRVLWFMMGIALAYPARGSGETAE